MADQGFDVAGMTREQQGRIAASSAIWLNALTPIPQFHVSMLRLCAGNIESLAQNYERALDISTSTVEPDAQQQQQRAA